uniref:Uncharacterized protein n=1 Tax=Tanacetum cinerariifolium TaxID=118510 RepID=A0A6L2KP62_TANCI|nr:hypothetical protein [Tanacetum cinerariifolium]
MLEFEAYKTYYAFAFGEKTLKPKYVLKKAGFDTSPKQKPVQDTKTEQLKLATKRSKKYFYISHASGSGDGVDTHSKGENDEEDDDEDDFEEEADINDNDSNDNDESDDERTKSDRDEIPDPNLTNELYDDVNVNLGNENTKMTNVDQGASEQENASHQSGFKQEEEDAHSHQPRKELSEIKQVDHYAQALSFIPAIIDRYMDNKLGEAINKAIQAHNFDCREEAQAEKREYIELVDSTVRTIIKEEVNAQLPQILPQAILDFATPVIEKNATESLEAAILTRSSSQHLSLYEAAATLFEFELTRILIDKMKKNKSFDVADYKIKLYDALIKSYNTDKDIF